MGNGTEMDKRSCIDIHAHYYPATFLKLIAEEGAEFGASVSASNPRGPVIDVGLLHAGPLAGKYLQALPDRAFDFFAIAIPVHHFMMKSFATAADEIAINSGAKADARCFDSLIGHGGRWIDGQRRILDFCPSWVTDQSEPRLQKEALQPANHGPQPKALDIH